MREQFPQHEHDPDFTVLMVDFAQPRTPAPAIVHGPGTPDVLVSPESIKLNERRPLDVFQSQPKPVKVAALNGVAGVILAEQGFSEKRPASTDDLLSAVRLAEGRLGFSYREATAPPVEAGTDRDDRISAALAASGLDWSTVTAEQLVTIAEAVQG